MPKFTDSKNRDWTIDISAGHLLDIKAQLSINLFKPYDGEPPALFALYGDLEAIIETFWILCKEQAAEREITESEFHHAIGSEHMEAAFGALNKALPLFFAKSGRPEVAKALEKTIAALMRSLKATGDAMGPEIDQRMDAETQKIIEHAKAEIQKASFGTTPD